jgi:alpha-ribazole phosphatase
MDLKHIYLIRHGATKENKEGILIGQTDPPLGGDSRNQLRLVRFPINPQVIYSSPLKRATETAYLLFPEQKVIIDPDLVERGFGDFEGKSVSSLTKKINGITTYAFRDEETLVRNHGESIEDLEMRIKRFKNTLETTCTQTIVVVSHGTLISHIVRVFFHEPSRRPSPENLHIVFFKLDKRGICFDLKYNVSIDKILTL